MDQIRDDVVAFLDANVESFEQLELLRMLGEAREKEWQIAALAKEVQVDAPTATRHLAALCGRGLITRVATGSESAYRFGCQTPELEQKLVDTLQVYNERPVSMIKLVYAQASNPLRAFADAFRVRKEK
jgi:predicted transcriptional regulator